MRAKVGMRPNAASDSKSGGLSDDLVAEFRSQHESGPVIQYGSVMRGYVSVPDDLLSDTDELTEWFERSRSWIRTLEPKPTKK